jgi:integrase
MWRIIWRVIGFFGMVIFAMAKIPPQQAKSNIGGWLNPKYSIHSARHTYGTHLYHATKNLRYVQKQLGHSNITMTSIYADILPSENGKLANMILEKA